MGRLRLRHLCRYQGQETICKEGVGLGNEACLQILMHSLCLRVEVCRKGQSPGEKVWRMLPVYQEASGRKPQNSQQDAAFPGRFSVPQGKGWRTALRVACSAAGSDVKDCLSILLSPSVPTVPRELDGSRCHM